MRLFRHAMLLIALLLAVRPLLASLDQAIVEPPEVRAAYAAMGDAGSAYNHGLSFWAGHEVPENHAEAAKWFRIAAERGLPEAQYNLAICYATGDGVEKNDQEAVRWFSRAGMQGLLPAQKMLIRCYAEGLGVAKSPATAVLWDFIARRTLELREEQPAGEPARPSPTAKGAGIPDGSSDQKLPDGTRVQRDRNGVTQTTFPDGRVRTEDPAGNAETRWPDGRRTREGKAKTADGRAVRVVETYDKDGQRLSQRVRDGGKTTVRDADGMLSIEYAAEDNSGPLTFIERYSTEGHLSGRELVRPGGKKREGDEEWTIKRWVESEADPAKEMQVLESYGRGGSILSQTKLPETERLKSAAKYPEDAESAVPAQTAAGIEAAPRSGVPAGAPDAGAKVPALVSAPREIAQDLAELREIAATYGNYAGATEADYAKARAVAAEFTIALEGIPQKPPAKDWLSQRLTSAGAAPPPAPRLVEIPTDLSEKHPLGLFGREVIRRLKWKHAETEHFVVHYVDTSDASPVMRFIECAYGVVVQSLHLDDARSTRKTHVFIFPDAEEWRAFLSEKKMPAAVAGFAYKDELFLAASGGKDDYLKTFCHEAAHAIVARFYSGRRWPLWLSEGFAEYMGARSMAVRRNHTVDRYLSTAQVQKPIDLRAVFRRQHYGLIGGNVADASLRAFYPNSEKIVSVLSEKLPSAAFPKFVNLLVAGNSPEASLKAAYGPACGGVEALGQLVNQK